MIKDTFSCIIPFYNEGTQLLTIINTILNIKLIDQIIIIDDGSTNDIFSQTTSLDKTIELIRLDKNQGKSNAVKVGLARVRNTNIVMLDADYQNLQVQEVERILYKYTHTRVDMLLVKVKGGNNWMDRVLRKEVLFTGFRVLKESDLSKVFHSNPKGYQLEVAINEFMIENTKKVAYIESAVMNVHKAQKWGLFYGLNKSIRMELAILNYLGLTKFLGQVFSFALLEIDSIGKTYN